MKINGVKLIIFDMDGTIYNTRPVTVAATRDAFGILGIGPVPSEDMVLSQIGEVSEVAARNLLRPKDYHLAEKLRLLILKKEIEFISRGRGELFPHVPQTLLELKKRGYTLVICSNCSCEYYDAMNDHFELSKYFEGAFLAKYITNDGTKIAAVRQIKEKFRQERSVFVGDRKHDFEAAKANGDVSIGAAYGYGKDEIKMADFVIKRFEELLDLF